jgi:hypothetical protein
MATNFLAIIAGAFAFYRSRKNRVLIEKSQRVKFSGFKLFIMMVIIAVFVQLGEAIMQLLKGIRYPWFVPLNHYLWFTAIWAIAGIWVAAQLTRSWKFSQDPYVYTKRALVGFLILTIVFSLASSRLGFYPALSLIALSLSIFIPNTLLKILATILTLLPMLRLMFFEMFPLGANYMSERGYSIDNSLKAFFYSGSLTLILIVWYLPILYLFAHTLASTWPKLKLLKSFRSPVIGIIILLAIIGYAGYLFSVPAYNAMWRAGLQVNAEYNLRSGKSRLRLTGNEFLRNVTITADTLQRHYDTSTNEAEITTSFKADWFKLVDMDSVPHDRQRINWQLLSNSDFSSEKNNGKAGWYEVSLMLRADTLEISDIKTDLKYKYQKNALTFAWFAEPPETLQVKASFLIHPQARLIREITAVYPKTPLPVKAAAEFADVTYRTIVSYRDTL